MFLLILKCQIYNIYYRYFTFHNVSINTYIFCGSHHSSIHFTFHNVSINTVLLASSSSVFFALHSTMFLLIQGTAVSMLQAMLFTFHNVSINTLFADRHKLYRNIFTFHNVSINTPLLQTYLCTFLPLYIPQCFY